MPDGGAIAFAVRGHGPPLFLVSGLGGAASFWDEVAPSLAERFTVVVHDHRGTGASSRCDRPYSVGLMAADALALMDHLGMGRVGLVGHSTGGAVGQHLALHAPDRLDRLVLSASWARSCPYMRRLFALRLRVLDALGLDGYREQGALLQAPPASIETVDPATGPPETPLGVEITRRRIGAVLAHDMQDALQAIATPTLVVTAQDDMVVSPYHSAGFARDIPGARLSTMPDGGHFMPRVHPEAYTDLLAAFLGQPR